MIAAMAAGYRVLGDERYLVSARRAAEFMLENMIEDDRLLHTHRAGESRLLGYIDDHANLAWGLIELFEATFESEWLQRACWIVERMTELFWDDAAGGFYFTGNDHEELIARMKPGHDGATPSGNAVAANVLLRLQAITGEQSYERRAAELMRTFRQEMERSPTGFAHMLAALDYYLQTPREFALVGPLDAPDVRRLLTALWRQFRPHDLIVAHDPEDEDSRRLAQQVPLLSEKGMRDGKPTFYVCESYACQAPTHDVEEVLRQAEPAGGVPGTHD
jgi:uncharacterized protein YyaL (SSP411 family)